MRVASIFVAFFVVLGAARPLSAQAGQETQEINVAVVLIPEGGTGLAEQTLVSMGIRRGIRAHGGLRDRHPADVMEDKPDDFYETEQEPDAIAELLRSGAGADAEARARSLLETFEDNLRFVKRSMLADTYTLLGVAQCLRRNRRECEDSFRRVVVFREHFFYDSERYPPDFEEIFREVQEESTDNGIRGSFEVVTEPEGAEVFVDGRSYGPSPATVEGLLVGDHYVTVKAIGFEKKIVRAAVQESYQETVDLVLVTSDKSRLVTEAMENIPPELGAPRAGDALSSLGTNLFVDQAVVGTINPSGDGAVEVHIYLYDLRTKFLLAEQEGRITLDAAGSEVAEQLLAALYDGVDLTGRVEAPDQGPNFGEATPIWKTWWFWTGLAVALIAGGIILGVATQTGDEPLPPGWYQVVGSFAAGTR